MIYLIFFDDIEERAEQNPENIEFIFALCGLFAEMKYQTHRGEAFQNLYNEKYPYYKKKIDEILEKNPNDINAYTQLYILHSGGLIENGYEKKYETLQKIVQLKPNDIEKLLTLCDMHLERGEFKKAYTVWQQAHQINPHHPDVHNIKNEEFFCDDFSPDHMSIMGDVFNQIQYPSEDEEPEMYEAFKNNKKHPISSARNN
jgi:tetratricopeptide (TPR) repeat protein